MNDDHKTQESGNEHRNFCRMEKPKETPLRAETAEYEAGIESNSERDSGIDYNKPEAEADKWASEQAHKRNDERSRDRSETDE